MRGLVRPGETLLAQRADAAAATVRLADAGVVGLDGPAVPARGPLTGTHDTGTHGGDLPPLGEHVRRALEGAALLVGVPMPYLLPDPELVPAESLHFFVVDPAWVRALQRGMLGAAASAPLDDAELDGLLDATVPARPPVTGLLLRSAVVERYPGLVVRAWTGPVGIDEDPDRSGTPVTILRYERLTPGMLVVMFEVAPDVVTIDEPPGMARLGIETGAARLRDASGALVEVAGRAVRVPVRWRGDAAQGVLDVVGLGADLAAARAANGAGGPDPRSSSAGFALHLLRPPARQRYQRGVTR